MELEQSVISPGAVIKRPDEEGEVPTHFLCPISLEVMHDPVTLCTGITYDRANIDRWLTVNGQDTCPVTNQRLVSKDLLPNLVLRSLILRWQCGMNNGPDSPSSQNFSAESNQGFHSLIQRIQYISSPPHLLQALVSLHALFSPQQNSSHLIRLALSTLMSLLRRSEEVAVREKALDLAEVLLKQVLEEEGAKGFLYADFVPTIVCDTMVGVSVAATILSLRMLCRVCEEEERCRRAAAQSGALSKLLVLLQGPQSCSRTRQHALQLFKLLFGHRRHHFRALQ